MAGNWDLSMDESCFGDWDLAQEQPKDQDVFDVRQSLLNLRGEARSGCCDVPKLEGQLQLLARRADDVAEFVELVRLVSDSLTHFGRELSLQVIEACCRVLPDIFLSDQLEAAKLCFDAGKNCLGHLRVLGDCLQGLILIIKIVEVSYAECQQRAGSKSDELFKLSTELLTSAIPIVEQQKLDIEGLNSLMTPLISVGKFLCKLEGKTMAIIWKLILRLLQQNPTICGGIRVAPTILFLISEVSQLFGHLNSDSSGVRLVKVISFLLKIIVAMIDLYKEPMNCAAEVESVLNLVLLLLSYTPDAIIYEADHLDACIATLLESQVTPVLGPLMKHLSTCSNLENAISSVVGTGKAELNIARLLAMFMTPGYQPENLSLNCVLVLFLNQINEAHVSLSGPVLLHATLPEGVGKPRSIPAYELLAAQACSGLRTAPSSTIRQCILTLVEHACLRGIWAYLMASDMLTFLCRCGSPSFRQQLIKLVFRLTRPKSRLVAVLNRLLSMLDPPEKSALLQTYPGHTHADVWMCVSWDSLNEQQQSTLRRHITSTPTATSILRLEQLSYVDESLDFVEAPELLDRLLQCGRKLTAALAHSDAAKNHARHFEMLTCSLWRVLVHLVKPRQENQQLFIQLLQFATEWGPWFPDVQLAMTELLVHWAAVSLVPPAPRKIGQLFAQVLDLSRGSVLVQYQVLVAFEAFAKRTPHAEVVSVSVRDSQQRQAVVKDFIERIKRRERPANLMMFTTAQARDVAARSKPRTCLPKWDAVEPSRLNMAVKRPRLEKCNEDVAELLKSIEQVSGRLSRMAPLPHWARDELRVCITTLSGCL